MSVVPLAVEPPARKLSRTLLGASPGEDLVGHVGYLTPNKRPELMIDAFARLLVLRPASRLVILGADRTNGALADALAAEPAAAARTTVTGYVPDGLLAGLVAALDVVIAFRGPHLGESSGPSATALAQGVPLVTQRIGAWADLPREVALWVPVGPDEPYSLARTLDAVLDDPELRGRLSRAGREYATRELGWSRIAAATAEIILQSRDLPPLSDLTAPPLPEWPPDGSGRDFEPYALGLADGTVVGFGAPISENRCPGFPPMVDGRPRRDPVDDPTPTEGAPWIARVSLADGEHLVAADGRIRTPAGEIDDGLVADVRFPLVDAVASPDRDGILMTDAHGHLFGFGAARAPAGLRRSPTRPVVAVAYATADSLLSQD